MRTRVEALLGVDCRQMWISTFHALCARLLRREAPHIGLSRDFVIYDSTDQLSVIKQALRELGMDDSTMQPRAGAVADQPRQEPDGRARSRSPANAWNPREQQIGKLYALYMQALEGRQRARLRRPAAEDGRAVRASPSRCATRYSEKFRYVMVDEYQDTNRPQYLLMQQLAGRHRNLCVVGDPDQSIYKWRGADLRNILDFEHDFPEVDDRQARAELPLDAGHPRRRVGGHRAEPQPQGEAALHRPARRREDPLLPRRRRPRRGRVHRAHLRAWRCTTTPRTRSRSCTAPTPSRERSKTRCAAPASPTGSSAASASTSARRSRTRSPTCKLVLNPHDDVSLRRVINVPARGIGKGVMESLDAVELSDADDDLPPLLAGLQPVATNNSLWAKLVHADRQRLVRAARARVADGVPRPARRADRRWPREESVSITLAKVLDQSGYLQDLREERSEEAEGRIENLTELVSAAREYETRSPEPSLGGFVDQLSLLSDVDEEAGTQRRARADDDDAQRQGTGVPGGRHRRPRGRTVPALALGRRRGRARGGAAPLLRRHHARRAPAGPDVGRHGAASSATTSRPSRRASSTRFRPS